MNLTKKRWLILLASCVINLCIGSMYAWSVFASPMAEHLAVVTGTTLTAASLAIVFTIANGVGPITMISGGRINDRLGPRWVVFAGGILFGAGMIASGFARSVPLLTICYGLGCGLGMGLVYGCTVGNSVKFFPDKRGLIGGITTATYGLSSVLIPPVANALIYAYGVTAAFKILGIAFMATICACSFLIQPCPPDFRPEGWELPQMAAGKQDDADWKQMLSDPIFYIMLLMLTCSAVSGLMTISQASAIAQNMVGMTTAAATMVVSILALFNVTGRVAAGWMSDRIGRINTLRCALGLSIVGLFLLSMAGVGKEVQFYIGISIVGLCFGSIMGVYPGFTADQFGAKNNSVNYGIMFVGFAAAGLLGPILMSRLLASTGAYTSAFLVAAVLSVAGLGFSVAWQITAAKRSK